MFRPDTPPDILASADRMAVASKELTDDILGQVIERFDWNDLNIVPTIAVQLRYQFPPEVLASLAAECLVRIAKSVLMMKMPEEEFEKLRKEREIFETLSTE